MTDKVYCIMRQITSDIKKWEQLSLKNQNDPSVIDGVRYIFMLNLRKPNLTVCVYNSS